MIKIDKVISIKSITTSLDAEAQVSFQPVTPQMRRQLEESLARHGVTAEQFLQAQQLAKRVGESLAAAYGEAVGREVEAIEFARTVLGVEGSGRLLVAVMREVTGRPDLYSELN